MGIPRELPLDASSHPNARKHGRVRCDGIHCSLGEIVDLSHSGARIRRKRRLGSGDGSMVNLEIDGLDGPIRVLARVVWTRRVGFFRHEVGVLFEDVSPEVRRALVTIARRAPSNSVLGHIEFGQARRSA